MSPFFFFLLLSLFKTMKMIFYYTCIFQFLLLSSPMVYFVIFHALWWRFSFPMVYHKIYHGCRKFFCYFKWYILWYSMGNENNYLKPVVYFVIYHGKWKSSSKSVEYKKNIPWVTIVLKTEKCRYNNMYSWGNGDCGGGTIWTHKCNWYYCRVET